MSRKALISILFVVLLSFSSYGQESPQTPNMIGFSVNNMIWSNNIGPVVNIEISPRPFRAFKFEIGYFFFTRNNILTFTDLPIHLEPKIKRFSGLDFLAEYKRYSKKSWMSDYAKNYLSAYYQYRYLSADGQALTLSSNSSFEFNGSTVYKNLESRQTELINELGIKFGSQYLLARIKSRPLLLDVYFGVGYQFILQDLKAEGYDPDDRIYFRKLKNGTLISRQGDETSRDNYFVPVLKFGVNLNLAFPKT